MLACAHPTFDGPVILFQNIIEILHRSKPRSQSALNLWGVTLDPSPDGDVVDQKSTLSKKLLDVTVGQ